MKNRKNALVVRIFMAVLAVLVVIVFVAPARAGISGDLFVHNYRDEVVIVKVVKTDATVLQREVEAQSTFTIYIGDNEVGTTWIYYADSNGIEIDQVPAWEAHADYHLEIH